MSDNLIPPISNASIAAKQPVSEDLFTRIQQGRILLQALIAAINGQLLTGAVDSVSTTTITDANPTGGSIDRDNKFKGYYLRFLNGAVFTANNQNRFKITAVGEATDTITVAEDLAALGVLAGDLYEVIGHTHDGSATDADGSKIDLKDLVNVLEGIAMTQNLADSIVDPDGLRGTAATKANPLATIADASKTTTRTYTEFAPSGDVSITFNHGFNGIPNKIVGTVLVGRHSGGPSDDLTVREFHFDYDVALDDVNGYAWGWDQGITRHGYALNSASLDRQLFSSSSGGAIADNNDTDLSAATTNNYFIESVTATQITIRTLNGPGTNTKAGFVLQYF